MPIWAPPTPPQDDNDIYIDHSVHFLYEYSTMTETQLPAVYVRKDHRKPRIETVTTRKQKQKKEEQPRVPRSLFDRPTAALVKMRREQKMLKLKERSRSLEPFLGLMKTQPARPMLGTLPSQKPAQEQPSEQQPEWTIFEDWALLQAVQTLQNLPLNLTVIAPAHTPNWDMVSEVVNNHNAHHRTAKQCRLRYENTIIPREEGRILYDISPRKQKKTKGIYKTKNNRPMKTSQLFVQEGSNQVTEMHSHRFDVIRNISAKRPPALRQVLVNPNSRNPKHLAILQAHNIDFDNPLTPVQVAANRAERIAREKKQTQNAAAAAAAAAERQAAAQQGSQQGQATASTTPTVTAVVTTAAATPVAVTAQQLQPLAGSTAVLVGPPDSLAKAVANNLRVQARPGGTPYITTLASSGQVAQLTAQVVASQPRAPTSTTAVPASTSLPSSQRIATIAGPTATGLKNINILRQSQSMVRGQGPQAQKLQPTKLSLDPRQQSIKRVQTAPIATQKVITQYNLAPGQKQSVVRLPDHTIEALKMQQLRQKVQTTHVGPQIMAQVQMAQTLASSQPVATLVKSVPAPTGSIPNVTIPVSINVSNQQKVVAANRATVSQLHQQQKLHLLQQQQQQRKVTPQMQAQKMQSISHLQSRGIPLIIPNKNIPGSSQLTQTLLQQIVKQQQQQQAQGGLTGVTTHGSQPTIIVSQNPPAGASATATVVPKSSIATAVQSSQIQTMAASAPITITQVPAASTAAASSAVSSVTGMAQAVMKAVSGTPGVSTVQLHTMPAGGVGQQAAVQRASLPQSLMTTTQLAQQQAAAQPQQQQVAAHPSPASTPTQQLASPGTPTTLQTIQVQAAVPPPASPSPTPTQPQIPGTPTQIPGGSVSPSQQPKASPYAMRTRNTPKHS